MTVETMERSTPPQATGRRTETLDECREREERKTRHLNAVLQSIRDVNRLIIKATVPEALIEGVCESLVRNRGFFNAWIVLLDDRRQVAAGAAAGTGADLDTLRERIRGGDPPLCCDRIFESEGFLAVADPPVHCGPCPFSRAYDGRGAMSSRLAYGKRIFGVLTVSVPARFSTDPEEQELFRDVADDIAYALHSIEAETERRRHEAALREARDQLERRVRDRTRALETLSAQLLRAQEEERKRIAGDLHDGIGQCLSAVKFMVESALEQMRDRPEEPALTPLKALVPLLREASEEVRTIIMNLRPSILDDLGILATVGWFCRQFQTVYSYIRVSRRIEVREEDVPEPLKIIVFRILQEAMNNVAKHGEADRIQLFLGRKKNMLELQVEDNGKGFAATDFLTEKSADRGFGIAGMRERAELSGGELLIDSAPGRGTVVWAAWPYSCILRTSETSIDRETEAPPPRNAIS
jgi:signal transduction histidine kinase